MSVTTRGGSRVALRPPTAADEAEFTALARRSRRFHAGWVAPARDSEQYGRYLARGGPDFEALLVIRPGDGAILGTVNISQIVHGAFQSAYLGYWIGAPHAGRGYMSEGLALALSRAFGALRLHRVEANIQPENVPSRRLVDRLGFRLEGYSPKYLKVGGRWRDHERWALLRDEWNPRR